eukprot:446640_1
MSLLMPLLPLHKTEMLMFEHYKTANGNLHWSIVLRIGRAATCIKWSPNGTKFAVGSGSKQIPVCHYEKSQDMWVAKMIKKAGKSSILAIDWSPNNMYIIAGGSDFKCRIFSAYIKDVDADCKTEEYGGAIDAKQASSFGTALFEFDTSKGWIESVGFSPNGMRFAFTGHDSSVHFGGFDGGAPTVQTLKRKKLPMRAIAFLTDTVVIAAGYDCVPFLYEYNGKEWVEKGPIDTGAKSKAAPKKQESAFGSAFSKFNKAVALPYRDDNNLKHEQYEQLDIDFDNNSWAQQPHLKSRSKPKQSAPKTTDAKPKESEKKQKDESVEEVDSKPTKTEQDTDALAVTEQVNEDTDALVITKQATDAVMAGQATDNNEQAIVAVDEASEANNNAFPDTPNEATDDVQIQMDDDIEIVTEDSVNIKQTPTPSDDAEIVVKVSDEEKSQSSAATQEDKVDHVKVGTPIRVTLESAWNSGGSDDEDGSAEDRDMMGDLASVRVEIDRRVLNNLAPINDMETPQSTAL